MHLYRFVQAPLLFHYVVPVYVMLILQDVLFTILFTTVSPYNNNNNNSSNESAQSLSLTSALCFNATYRMLTAPVSLVFKRDAI